MPQLCGVLPTRPPHPRTRRSWAVSALAPLVAGLALLAFMSGPAWAACPQILVTDVNGDWMPDQIGIREGRLYVLEQTPSGYVDVTGAWLPESPEGVRCLLAAQFNSDDLLDLAAATSDAVHVFINDAQQRLKAWGRPLAIPSPGEITDIGFGDLDGDDREDLVVGRAGSPVAFMNLGGSEFRAMELLPRRLATQTVEVEDIDADTQPDIVLDESAQRVVLLNPGRSGGAWTLQSP